MSAADVDPSASFPRARRTGTIAGVHIRDASATETWLLRLLATRAGVPIRDRFLVVDLEDGGMGSIKVARDVPPGGR
jgi:hypothetical protein